MKVRFIFNSRIPPIFGAEAITLYPFVLVASGPAKALATGTIAHELVHVLQVRALGWFRFYAAYIAEHLLVGYIANRFEPEAFQRQHDPELRPAGEQISVTG